jgi:hypothetical protein
MAYRWFFPCTPVSSTSKTDRHDDTAEIFLKAALIAITSTLSLNALQFKGDLSSRIITFNESLLFNTK